jgi:hypothetical protein
MALRQPWNVHRVGIVRVDLNTTNDLSRNVLISVSNSFLIIPCISWASSVCNPAEFLMAPAILDALGGVIFSFLNIS